MNRATVIVVYYREVYASGQRRVNALMWHLLGTLRYRIAFSVFQGLVFSKNS